MEDATCFYCDGARPVTWPATRDSFASCDKCHARENDNAHERFVTAFYGGNYGPDEAKLDAASRDAGRRR